MNCSCTLCGRSYIWIRNKGGTTKQCNSCWTKVRREKLKEKYRILAGNKCSQCGYNRCPKALHFHHIDPTTKKFGISNGYNKKQTLVIQELAKCVLLCANCHIELHNQ